MKFMKGMIMGSLISAGMVMMYMENQNMSKKKIMKKGKQTLKKMGIM